MSYNMKQREKLKFNKLSDFNEISKKYGNKILDIDIPIIGIFGLGEKTETGKLAKHIKTEFKLKGYEVKLIISEADELDDDSFAFPIQLFEGAISDLSQIYRFNHMVYEICKVHQPDLLLIEIPKGILPISEEVNNEFGILPFKVASAVCIDLGILCMYADNCVVDIIAKIKNVFIYRFSIDEVYFGVCDKMLDWTAIRAEKRLKVMNSNHEEILHSIKSITDYYIFSTNEINEVEKMATDIELGLIDNSLVDLA